jgi:hypothetical protein
MNSRTCLLLSALCAVATAIPAQGSSYTLSHGNSAMTVFVEQPVGFEQWSVDGQLQLFQQQFFYRVGSVGGESAIYSLPVVGSTLVSPSLLKAQYANDQFALEIVYSLLGGTAGSGLSSLSEQVKITNLGDSALNFHFYEYADFDLGGVPEGDTIQLGKNLQGLFNEAAQSRATLQFSEAVYRPGATHATVGVETAVLGGLTDGSPSTLDNNAGPVSGDVAYAFQWDVVIGAGSSVVLGMDKTLSVALIPEPATGALFGLGLVTFVFLRRCRR